MVCTDPTELFLPLLAAVLDALREAKCLPRVTALPALTALVSPPLSSAHLQLPSVTTRRDKAGPGVPRSHRECLSPSLEAMWALLCSQGPSVPRF